jgi:hypothetical protein
MRCDTRLLAILSAIVAPCVYILGSLTSFGLTGSITETESKARLMEVDKQLREQLKTQGYGQARTITLGSVLHQKATTSWME